MEGLRFRAHRGAALWTTLLLLAGPSLLLFAASASSAPKPTAFRPSAVTDHTTRPVPDPIHVDQGGDTIASATPIPSLPYSDSGTTEGYADDYIPRCGRQAPARDVVYSYTPTADVQVDIDLCGSSYDTILFVFQGDPFNQIGCNDDACGYPYPGFQSALTNLGLIRGRTYYIVVDGYDDNEMGPYTLHVALSQPVVVDPATWGRVKTTYR